MVKRRPDGAVCFALCRYGNNPVSKFDPTGGVDGDKNPAVKQTADATKGTASFVFTEDVIVVGHRMKPSEIYNARMARGVDPFSGPNGDRVHEWRKWYDEMYADYASKMHPDIEGIQITGGYGIKGIVSTSLTLGYVAGMGNKGYQRGFFGSSSISFGANAGGSG